jgi:hypothetical protein
MMKEKKFWDDYKVVKDVPKNDKGDVIRVGIGTRNGRSYVDVRTYYLDEDLVLKPGKGISIPDDLADEVALTMIDSISSGGEEDE